MKLENLPVELIRQPRFFPMIGIGKTDTPKGWNLPANQMTAETALKCSKVNRVGCDITGKGQRADYLAVDFDNVFDSEGNFVTEEAERWFNYVASAETFCERSISGRGLHFLFLPTPNKFEPVNKGDNGILYLDPNNSKVKIELYYRASSKYFLLTGDVYNCEPQTEIVSGEVADNIFQTLLNEIQNRLPKKSRIQHRPDALLADDDSEYDLFLAKKILEKLSTVDHKDLSYERWLAVQSACKAIGVPYEFVDAFNSAPSNGGNYNSEANLKRWQGLDANPDQYGVGTLIGIAKKFGFVELDVRKEWIQQHPEMFFSKGDRFSYLRGNLTDLTNARRLEKFCSDRLKFIGDDDRWLTFNDGVWNKHSDKPICVLPFINNFHDRLKNTLLFVDDKTEKEFGDAVVKCFEERKSISPTISLLKGCASILITADDLNKHPNLLNCLNGVIDLQTGKLMPAAPELLLTQQCSVAYDPDAQSQLIEKFFCDIMPNEETRAGILRWLGYCLTGDVREEKFFVWKGDGANGKGVLSRIMTNLLGNYAAALPRGALLLRKFEDGNQHTASLNGLVGARFVISEELPQNISLDSALLKSLTGGDLQTFREMYHEFKTFKPTGKINLSSNFVPTFENSYDQGIERRLLVAPFTQIFRGDNCDPLLKQKLLTPENQRALLKLLVDESVAWYRDGLIISAQMTEATRENIQANDWLLSFLEDNCTLGSGEIPRRKLIDMIRSKCIEAHRFSDRDIVKMLEYNGVGYKKTMTGRVFTGIRLFNNSDFAGAPVDPSDVPFD